MPLLDVTAVLSSPMLMDSFTVTRRQSGVSATGRTTMSSTTTTQTGVVSSSGENSQDRPKEYATGRKSILVITTYRLRQQSQGVLPDLVGWRGDLYLVQTIEDYTNYGRGFVQAYCTSEDLQDAAPQ
jgi:galactose-6-phosphate isomerase